MGHYEAGGFPMKDDTGTGQRAALYVRVSSDEQTTLNQEPKLRQWAKRLGLKVVKVYDDTASGGRDDRAQLTALLDAAHRREFDTLLLWDLDRLTRAGVSATFRYLEQLWKTGGHVTSLGPSW